MISKKQLLPVLPVKVIPVKFIFLIFISSALICLSVMPLIAENAGNSDFFMGEGLYINKHYEEAFEYYQSAFVGLTSQKGDPAILKKVLLRLITVSAYLGKTRLNQTYSKQLKSMFNLDPETHDSLPSAGRPDKNINQKPAGKISGPDKNKESAGKESAGKESAFKESAGIKKSESRPSDLKIQILLYYGGYEPYEIIRYLNMDEKNAMQYDRQAFIKTVLLEAKQQFAAERGYSVVRFGQDNYKLLQIQEVKYRIYDASWGRSIIDSEENNNQSETASDFWDDY
jgi:hypothetical protein